jgi:hypothetical protein
MDHPTHLADENPWRATAMVAAGVAAIELCVIVIIATVFVVKPLLDRESASAASPARKQAAKSVSAAAATQAPPKAAAPDSVKATDAKLSRGETRVLVLNGNGRPGAAGERGGYVRAKGYQVTGTANAPRSDFARSLVMYRPGYKAEALRFGRDIGVRRVVPLDGLKPRDLQGAVLVLIVGQS